MVEVLPGITGIWDQSENVVLGQHECDLLENIKNKSRTKNMQHINVRYSFRRYQVETRDVVI